jgi:intracellular septation protein
MTGLLKILNNPLTLIVVMAGTWYPTRDFLALTVVIMSFVTLQVLLEKIVNGDIPDFLFGSWCLLMPLGSLTLFFRDPSFLQWKFSIVYWLFGLILIVSRFLGKKDILRSMLSLAGPQLKKVEDTVWKRANFCMAFGLILLGFLNLYVIQICDCAALEDDMSLWVNFKFYGATIYNLLLLGSVGYYIFSNVPEENSSSSRKDEIEA